MPLLAHSGHWLVDLAYLAPFAGLLIWLGFTMVRERRRADREAAPDEPES